MRRSDLRLLRSWRRRISSSSFNVSLRSETLLPTCITRGGKRFQLIRRQWRTSNVGLSLFMYDQEQTACIADVTLPDGRRVLLFGSRFHLKRLASALQLLIDGTFRITPKLWCQTFIISAQVTSGVFVPVVFGLLPDKKRETYDAFFSALRGCLENHGLQLSARYIMSGNQSVNLSKHLSTVF